MGRATVVVFAALCLMTQVGGALAAGKKEWTACRNPDPDTAIAACSQIIARGKESARDRAEAAVQRGQAYRAKGDDQRALRDFDSAIGLHAADPIAFRQRGALHLKQGRLDLARADLTRAFDLRPEDPQTKAAFAELKAAEEAQAAERKARETKECEGWDWNAVIEACSAILARRDTERRAAAAALAKRAQGYFHQRRFELALTDIDGVIAGDLEPAAKGNVRSLGAFLRLLKGEHDRALADLDAAIAEGPKSEVLLVLRILALTEKGEFEIALADVERLKAEADPAPEASATAALHGLLGYVYAVKGDIELALVEAERAAAAAPKGDSPLPFIVRGVAYLKSVDHERAAAELDRAIALAGEELSFLLRRYRGAAHLGRGDLDKALEDLDATLRLATGFADAWRNRGEVHRRIGKLDLARADLERALSLKPDDPDAKRSLVELEAAERKDKAQREDAERKAAAARACEATEDDAALAACSTVIALGRAGDSDFKAALTKRSRLYVEKREFDLALADLDQLVGLGADFDVRVFRGVLRFLKGDHGGAMADLDAAIAGEPKDSGLQFLRVLALAERGEIDAALAQFDQVRAILGETPQRWDQASLHALRGYVLALKGEVRQALAEAEQASPPDGQELFGRVIRGVAYLRSGEHDRAIAELDAAIALVRGDKVDLSFLLLRFRGWAHLERGDPAKALEDLDTSIRFAPGYADAYRIRGEVHRRMGKPGLARADFEQALRLRPEYPDAKRSLAELDAAEGKPHAAAAATPRAEPAAPAPQGAVPGPQPAPGSAPPAPKLSARVPLECATGSPGEIVAACTKVIEAGEASNADLARAYHGRASALARLFSLQRALDDLTGAIGLAPQEGLYYAERGALRQRLGELDPAIADFDRALALDRGNLIALWNRAEAHLQRGDLARARADVQRLAELQVEALEIRRIAGRIDAAERQAGQPDPAKAPPKPPIVAAGKRMALVIGNAAYRNTRPLANPANDAADTAAALRRLGFSVLLETDLTKQGMDAAFSRFAREARGADAALFYYAGHAMQFAGTNYLMPVDASLQDEAHLPYEMAKLDDVIADMRRVSGVRIAVLDACRDNPLEERLKGGLAETRGGEATSRGLAPIARPAGLLVAYATQPGRVARDGTARNSPFTDAFLRHLEQPGLEVGLLFRRVAAAVHQSTGGEQVPELSISLLGEFYFRTER